MLGLLLTIFIGILGGIAVGLQGPIVSEMSRRVGTTASSFVVHVSGAILSGLLLVARGGENIRSWTSLSWYMLGSGFFGLALYLTLNQTMPRLGATTALSLIIIGQLAMGIIIDAFGLFGIPVRSMDLSRLAGVLLLAVGGYLVVR